MAKAQAQNNMPVASEGMNVPNCGVFGELDNQLRSYLAEMAIQRMDVASELLSSLQEENKIIAEMRDVSRNRTANLRKMARNQGLFVPVDNSGENGGAVDNSAEDDTPVDNSAEDDTPVDNSTKKAKGL